MDSLFDKIDAQVDAALKTLFPSIEKSVISETSDAQQRAQDFATQVTQLHSQVLEAKSKLDELPDVSSDAIAELHKEISDLKQDIAVKDNVLEKHRKILQEHAQLLHATEVTNRTLIENND